MTGQRRRLLLWLAALLSLTGPAAHAQASKLRVLVSSGYTLPFAEIVSTAGIDSLRSGIIRDWSLALAERLGREPQFVLVPARRIGSQVRQGGFDIQCFENPQWYDNEAETQVEWLQRPLMSIEEVLVGLQGMALVRSLSELEGKTVGVVNGYRYPLLDPLFDKGRVLRSNAPNEERLIQMQRLGRADYSVLNPLQLAYAQSRDPALRKLVASPLVISQTPLFCLRQRNASVSITELANAQQALLAEGRLNEILRRYR